MIRRSILLVVSLVAGYVLGDLLAWLLLIPVAMVKHLSDHWVGGVAVGGGVLGAVVGFLKWRRGSAPASSWGVHGSARWATATEVRSLVRPDGLIVGRENRKGGRLLRYAGQQHLITVAPTRAGKGVGAIIPNLLTADRSVLCIDPKGENARAALHARQRFGPVDVLDPFGVTGVPNAAFNPLDGLDEGSPDLVEDAMLLADALVYDPPGQTGEAHWNEEAKALIAGLIMYVVVHENPDIKTLITVRELLTQPPDDFGLLLSLMQKSRHGDGLIARAANRHLGKSGREAAGVLSSAQRHTHFLDSRRMASVLDHSSFRFEDLKAGTCTVFLVLPPDRLGTHSRWLRLLVAQAIGALARSTARPDKPVLLLLDEFAALGRLEPLEQAFGLMAGYGLQLWPILQDLHQLWSVYGERAGTFLSNAGLIQVFNVGDVETASWVSKSIGAATMAYQTAGASVSKGPGPFFWPQTTTSTSTANHLTRRELLTPDEVMRLDANLEILLRQGAAPMAARKVRYYADAEFQHLFTAAIR
ncbi:MAG: type IV secretory system conjugative DNA transfer family protein [Caulobacteraceae bacterium]|nr:type IV secretory system conjugative DNA transfer family protein [Caulobacteraceae bacterium]